MANNNTEVDSDRIIKYRGKQYQIIPEITPRGCNGCALYNSNNCSSTVTSECLKGFILKKVDL